MTKINAAYWYRDKALQQVEEYLNPDGVGVMNGGVVVIYDSKGRISQVLAPGDWHDLVLDYEEEE